MAAICLGFLGLSRRPQMRHSGFRWQRGANKTMKTEAIERPEEEAVSVELLADELADEALDRRQPGNPEFCITGGGQYCA
jgi:hypothetical protein